MEHITTVELTNMCIVYDGQGNVLVEEKILKDRKGLVFPGDNVEGNESVVDSAIQKIKKTRLQSRILSFVTSRTGWLPLDCFPIQKQYIFWQHPVIFRR